MTVTASDVNLIATALRNHARDNRHAVEGTPMRGRVEDQLIRDADRCDVIADLVDNARADDVADALDRVL